MIALAPACGAPSVHRPLVRAAATVTTTSSTSTTTTTTTAPSPPAAAVPRQAERSVPPVSRPRSASGPAAGGASLGRFTATCYGAFEGYGGRTASGQQSGPGSIATDPSVIPMGTRLVVEGYGAGVANDVGGAVRGRRLDVWFRTAAECRAWGTRSVEVSRAA